MNAPPVVVVLAAGRGSRYLGPRHKLAEPLDGRSVLARTVGLAIASGLGVLVVTTPALADEATRLVARRDVLVLPHAQGAGGSGGMGDSIAAGVAARGSAGGWLMLPADMPLVRPETVQRVAAGLGEHAVCFAQYRGQRGHPVGFGAELFSELVRLEGDDGARRILSRYPAHGLELDDPGVLQDLDTEADLAAIRQQLARQA